MSAAPSVEGGPPPLPPARFNIAAHVLAARATTPDKTALRVLSAPGTVEAALDYADLDRRIRAIAGGLRDAGLEPGDRVALRIANSLAFPLLFFGTIAAGGVAVPMAAQLTEGESARLLERVAPRFLAWSTGLEIALPDGIAPLAPGLVDEMQSGTPGAIADTAADDPAFLIFTSGTSGRPRGVLHAQRSAWARRMMWPDWYGLGADDRVMHAGAFNWTYTLGTGLTDPWGAGATAIVHTGPRDPLIWPRLIQSERATLFAAVPGVYRQILRDTGDLAGALASLRHALTAGERLAPALAADWRARTGTVLHEALGMSEISTFISSSPARPAPEGTAGYPQTGRRVAILEEEGDAPVPRGRPGRLAVDRRDPGLMLGYWQEPEADRASLTGDWFVTGDRAVMAPDGAIAHLGRSDDVMNALGYRVAPQEVEEALAGHPAIAEIAVAEMPVRADLALITAFVVAAGETWDEAALAEAAAARLAPYKRPKVWIPVERLPRTANGKLQRRQLVEAHRRDR